MNIIVDAYGGDHAPISVLLGAQLAYEEYGSTVTLVGKEMELKELAKKENISLTGMKFIEATMIMPVDVEPSKVARGYADSSMGIALQALADGKGDAVVSAGSTGALVVGATLWVKRIKGIRRPALGVVIPDTEGFHLLIDSGANSEVRPEMLVQFGIMGSVYLKELMGIPNPRVGMINIGTEPNKGLPLQIEASKLMEQAPVNFIGNVEASQLPVHGCDVAVTDGFTGNIILKHTEGMAKMMSHMLKGIFLKNAGTKIGAMLLKGGLKDMSKKLDASEYGGVPLLGIRKPVIKAHGSSNAVAIKNAIGQGIRVAEQNMIGQIEEALEQLKKDEEPK